MIELWLKHGQKFNRYLIKICLSAVFHFLLILRSASTLQNPQSIVQIVVRVYEKSFFES